MREKKILGNYLYMGHNILEFKEKEGAVKTLMYDYS